MIHVSPRKNGALCSGCSHRLAAGGLGDYKGLVDHSTRPLAYLGLAIIISLSCLGCSIAHVSIPGDPPMSLWSCGAPLVSRAATISARHEWLDADNVLHVVEVSTSADENADAQLKALDIMATLIHPTTVITPDAP